MNMPLEQQASAWMPWLLALLVAAVAWQFPPFAQPPGYHAFADQRACWGVRRCLDTLSNGLFMLAGVIGLAATHVARRQGRFRDPREAGLYRLLFLAAILLGLGSGYYHLAPDNPRLLLDRLAMMLVFMTWIAALAGERISLQAGVRLLPVLLAAGLGSAAWWGWSEARGAGDLRPYLAMQAYAMLLVLWLVYRFPPRYSGAHAPLAVLGLYLLALLGDLGDRVVFDATGGAVSGHTLKHGVAALALVLIAWHVRRRRAL